MVKVSVIMPVYNVEKYLRQCLDSLLNQTLQEFEIICVDDGSKDSSLAILQEYQQKDDRVKVLTQQNKYAGVARNNGLKIAQGEYVFFLDSDDFFEKDMFTEVYNQGKKVDADIVIFGARKFDQTTQKFGPSVNSFKEEYMCGKEVFNWKDQPFSLLLLTVTCPWTKGYKREFIIKEGLQYQALQNTNDYYFSQMALCLADRITTVNKILTNYRVGMNTNLQALKDKKNPLCFVEAVLGVYNELKKRGIYEKLQYAFVNTAVFEFAANLRSLKTIEAFTKVIHKMKDEDVQTLRMLSYNYKIYLRKNDYSLVNRAMKVRTSEEIQELFNNRNRKKRTIKSVMNHCIPKKLRMKLIRRKLNKLEKEAM